MERNHSRRTYLSLAGGAAVATLAGCLGELVGDDDARGQAVEGASGDPLEPRTTDDSPSTEIPLRDADVPLAHNLVEFELHAQSGGVPKDGIPSIDDPVFGDVSVGDAMMSPGDPVFGVALGGEVRAYPQRILVRHEIVNDEFGDRNIAVTYCPLTGTAIGFDRGEAEFGVSGMLVNSNLIMYDRLADAWWPQVLGTCVFGEFMGLSLHEVRVTWTTWERWKDVHPDTSVLTEETGSAFNYDRNVYGSYNPTGGYYDSSRVMFSTMAENDRFHEKEVVIGARSADGVVAFHKDTLREEQLLEASVNGVPYLAAYHHGLDSAWVYRNPEDVTFERGDRTFMAPNGTQYTADELPIESVNAFDAMWFAWVAFYPDTVVVE